MSSLDLRILDDTDDSVNKVIGRYSDGKAVEILRRYLEPGGDLSIGEATKLIDDMLPSPDERDLHFQLGNFGCLTLEQAQQIPYDHPAQMRFARLLQRLQRSYKLNEICCTDEVCCVMFVYHRRDLCVMADKSLPYRGPKYMLACTLFERQYKSGMTVRLSSRLIIAE